MPFVNTYWIFLSVATYVSSVQVEKVVYDGAQVWRTVLRSAENVLLIKGLIDNQDVSIWSLSPTQADFLVRYEHREMVNRMLSSQNINHTVLILDVQRSIDAQPLTPSLWTENSLKLGHRLDWHTFPTLSIIEEYFNFLADDYSSMCKVQTIGYTSENRTIKMINVTNGNPDNEIIIVTGGTHGRDWISVTSVLFILHTIVTEFDKQYSLQDKNWLIIPVVNPDGYVYTHSSDRLWRKNRNKFKSCIGADINRNFEIDWGVTGIADNNECKETYSGPFPFSEAESLALRNIIKTSKGKPIAMVDIQAYGNLILFPWSARTHVTKDVQLHKETAKEMTRAIYQASKKKYTYGATYHVAYPTSGTFLDWAYANEVSHSYVLKTRDKGQLGFLVPPEEIEETGNELFAAVHYLAKIVTRPSRQGNDSRTWF